MSSSPGGGAKRFPETYETRLTEIHRLARRLAERKKDLIRAAAEDAGFPATVTAMEVDLAVDYLRTMDQEVPWVCGGRPYGTVAAIFPYDAPAVMLARLGGGSLLTGNRLRFSFSSWSRRTAEIITEIAADIDPLEPVADVDNRAFGRSCVADDAVRVLFISGASAVGEAYRRERNGFDKVFFAGPSGMPAAVVFSDADPDAAARFIAKRAFVNGGQYCTTLKKALIQESVYHRVRDRIMQWVGGLRVGDPLDPATDIGPIRVERTRALLQAATEQFRQAVVFSGKINSEWIDPWVLEAETIPDLELFGPVLVLKPFRHPEEAVHDLIQTRYGFLLAFFGSPPAGGEALFHEHFGMVFDAPDFLFMPLRLPFGGKKASGWILERRGDGWAERDGAFIYSRELAQDAGSSGAPGCTA
jgi:succinate-semialdehyde dehydrogenase/glutarate-semialdehyde dehydrogenase